nr:tigger transposable element-derived protein 1-like [Cherax quadricarinatus]
MDMKKEIIAKYESGVRVSKLARLYTKPQSTIATIVAKKTAIKEAVLAKGATMFSKLRSQVIEDIERLLLVWINEKQIAGDSISQAIICEKARKLHEDLIRKMPATSGDVSEFKASKGWFERFKNRSGIHSVIRHGEAASLDQKAAEKYVQEFKEYIDNEELKPEQVFNCDTDNVVKHLRNVIKEREIQVSMDRYVVRQRSSDSQAGPSGIKRRREVTPKKDLPPQVLMEGDSPSKH